METSLDWSVWLPAWILTIGIYLVAGFTISGEVSIIDAAGVAAGFGLGLLALEIYHRRSDAHA